MIIEITQSGGFAGLPAASGSEKRVAVAEMPEASRDDICKAFDPKNLNTLAERSVSSRAADMFTYHIVVTGTDGKRHEYDLREDQLPPEMLDLIDGM